MYSITGSAHVCLIHNQFLCFHSKNEKIDTSARQWHTESLVAVKKLPAGESLKDRLSISTTHLIELTHLCPRTVHSSFSIYKFYKQPEGAAVGNVLYNVNYWLAACSFKNNFPLRISASYVVMNQLWRHVMKYCTVIHAITAVVIACMIVQYNNYSMYVLWITQETQSNQINQINQYRCFSNTGHKLNDSQRMSIIL